MLASRPATVRRRRSRLRWVAWTALGLAGLAGALYAGVCAFMALTLTRPERHPFTHFPEQFGLTYDTVEFPSRVDALALRGWLLHPPAATPPRRRPVIVVHGKGTDRQAGPGDGILGVAAPLVRAGYTVLTFDLRASGQSGGERFTLGAQEVRDVGGAIEFLQANELAGDGVNLLGFSMGGATVLLTAESDQRVRAVVEDSGYADLGDLIDEQVPRVSGLPRFFTPGMVLAGRVLLGINLDTIRPAGGLQALAARGVPLLVIHGEDDTYVPPSHGRRIAAAYGSSVETYFVPGAGHIEAHQVNPAAYDARVRNFFDRTDPAP